MHWLIVRIWHEIWIILFNYWQIQYLINKFLIKFLNISYAFSPLEHLRFPIGVTKLFLLQHCLRDCRWDRCLGGINNNLEDRYQHSAHLISLTSYCLHAFLLYHNFSAVCRWLVGAQLSTKFFMHFILVMVSLLWIPITSLKTTSFICLPYWTQSAFQV